MRILKTAFLLLLLNCFFISHAQVTFPVNGVADPRTGYFAFTNATIDRGKDQQKRKTISDDKTTTGTLEAGKDANIIISTGDLFDIKTSMVTDAFIQGRKIDLNNKQTQLFERYRHRYGIQ